MVRTSEIDLLRNRYSSALDVIEAVERYLSATPDDDDEMANAWDGILERMAHFKGLVHDD